MDDNLENNQNHLKPEDRTCPDSPNGKHSYICIYEDWEVEKYECEYCRDVYKIYYEDMK
jgi:hypothetical protein